MSEDLAAIIGAMPAAVVLLRDRRSIAEVSGRFASVFGRPVVDLLGSDLLRFVAPGDASLVGSVIHEARSMAVGSVPASVVARFEQPDGSRRLVEVSAAHRADGSTRGATVVLLRPQTLRQGLNAALVPQIGWQAPGEERSTGEVVETALETIVGVLGCEPIAHDCYFLLPGEASGSPTQLPQTPDFGDAPPAGPWDEVLVGKKAWIDLDLASMADPIADYARRKHLAALRCVPVRASHDTSVVGCLVAWDRKERPLVETAETTFRYAAEIASLSLGRAQSSSPAPVAAAPAPVTAFTVPLKPAEPWPSDVDVITGLPLEETLVRSLDEMIATGQRPGLICIRLNALDRLRSQLGQFSADQLVRVSARRVNSLVRMTDEVYRTTDDGLAIVCTGVLDGDRLSEISDRLRERLGVPFRVDTETPVDVEPTVSALQVPDKAVTATELLASVRRTAV